MEVLCLPHEQSFGCLVITFKKAKNVEQLGEMNKMSHIWQTLIYISFLVPKTERNHVLYNEHHQQAMVFCYPNCASDHG